MTVATSGAFLIVTPIGLEVAAELESALRACGVRLGDRCTIHPWSHASSRLYVRGDDATAVTRARRFETQWRAMFPADRAERWNLVANADYALLCAHKASLRQRFGGLPLAGWGTTEPAFRLHAFHVPDACSVAAESRRLEAFVAGV